MDVMALDPRPQDDLYASRLASSLLELETAVQENEDELKMVHTAVAESRALVAAQRTTIDQTRRQLELDRADLDDQVSLHASLERRIARLRLESESTVQMSAQEATRRQLDEVRERKDRYHRDTTRLLRTLNRFIKQHLGVMLAAEELGGPVVGDVVDIDTDDLVGGFNTHGKAKAGKARSGAVGDHDVRQRRLDDIWGATAPAVDEAGAAGDEARQLLERLLNARVECGGHQDAAYVEAERDSAAVRFLVRAKVAQFHPRDATQLRLLDFGRELED